MAENKVNDYYTKIPDSIIGLHRAGKLTGGEFSVYVLLIQLVKMQTFKSDKLQGKGKSGAPLTTRMTTKDIAAYCGVSERLIENALKKFRDLKIIESSTGKEQINGKWRTKSRKITFLVSAYGKKGE